MLHRIHLSLVPITWSQTLTHEGATILPARMKCAPHARCELKLRDGTRLTEHEIELTILNGEMRAEDRVKYKLVEEAIGGLWFVDDKDISKPSSMDGSSSPRPPMTSFGTKFAETAIPAAIFLSTPGQWKARGWMTRGGAATRSRSSAHQSALTASRRLTNDPREKVGLGADGGDRR